MPKNSETNYTSDVHFRVPKDFMRKVHLVARAKGMTASNFMRSTIVDALRRSESKYTELEQAGSWQQTNPDETYQTELPSEPLSVSSNERHTA